MATPSCWLRFSGSAPAKDVLQLLKPPSFSCGQQDLRVSLSVERPLRMTEGNAGSADNQAMSGQQDLEFAYATMLFDCFGRDFSLLDTISMKRNASTNATDSDVSIVHNIDAAGLELPLRGMLVSRTITLAGDCCGRAVTVEKFSMLHGCLRTATFVCGLHKSYLYGPDLQGTSGKKPEESKEACAGLDLFCWSVHMWFRLPPGSDQLCTLPAPVAPVITLHHTATPRMALIFASASGNHRMLLVPADQYAASVYFRLLAMLPETRWYRTVDPAVEMYQLDGLIVTPGPTTAELAEIATARACVTLNTDEDSDDDELVLASTRKPFRRRSSGRSGREGLGAKGDTVWYTGCLPAGITRYVVIEGLKYRTWRALCCRRLSNYTGIVIIRPIKNSKQPLTPIQRDHGTSPKSLFRLAHRISFHGVCDIALEQYAKQLIACREAASAEIFDRICMTFPECFGRIVNDVVCEVEKIERYFVGSNAMQFPGPPLAQINVAEGLSEGIVGTSEGSQR